jgi:ribose transport system substrate-binding protein
LADPRRKFVATKESAGLTGVVLKAIDAKIPVIVLDRNVNTDKYTQFIGGDNVVIGQTAGEYAVNPARRPRECQGKHR